MQNFIVGPFFHHCKLRLPFMGVGLSFGHRHSSELIESGVRHRSYLLILTTMLLWMPLLLLKYQVGLIYMPRYLLLLISVAAAAVAAVTF